MFKIWNDANIKVEILKNRLGTGQKITKMLYIFPHYIPNELYKEMKEISGGSLSIAMEYMSQCIPYLHKIQILDPQIVANELIHTGAKRGDLYPDMQIISQDIENVI